MSERLRVKWKMSMYEPYALYDENGPGYDTGTGVVIGVVHVRRRDEINGDDCFIVLRTDGGGKYKRGPFDRVPVSDCEIVEP